PLEISDALKDIGCAVLARESAKPRPSKKPEEWTLAAKCFNGALALCEQDTKRCDVLLFLMTDVEKRFLEIECGKKLESPLDPNDYMKRRKRLATIRYLYAEPDFWVDDYLKITKGKDLKFIRAVFDDRPWIGKVLQTFSGMMTDFSKDLLEEIYPVLGFPSNPLKPVFMGSIAQGIMGLYSDLEFAFLMANASPENLEHARKVAKLFEIRVICLGETPFNFLQHGRVSPTPKGFCFDEGGNTPLGKGGNEELIRTPSGLAQFQSPANSDLILSNALRAASGYGDPLYEQYVTEMKVILDSFNPKNELTLRKKMVLELIEGHLRQFEPIMSRDKEEFLEFDIKMELLRLPVFLVVGLAEYVGIVAERNPFVILEELKKQKVLNDIAVNHILKALRSALILRVLAHVHYGRECDRVFHPCMRDRKDLNVKDPFFLLHKDVVNIIHIYRVLFPMHRFFKQFIKTRDLAALSRQNFYEETLFSQWETQEMFNRNRDEKYDPVYDDQIRDIIAKQRAAEEKEASKQLVADQSKLEKKPIVSKMSQKSTESQKFTLAPDDPFRAILESEHLDVAKIEAKQKESAKIMAEAEETQATAAAFLTSLANQSQQSVEAKKTPDSPYEVAKRRVDSLSAKQAAFERNAREARIRQDRFKQIYANRRRELLSRGVVKNVIQKDFANVKWAKDEFEKKRATLEEFEYNRHIQKAEREIELLVKEGRIAQKVIQNGQPVISSNGIFDYRGDKQAILTNQEYELYKRTRDHLISEVMEAERELHEMRKIYEETKQNLDPQTKKKLDEMDKAKAVLEEAWEDYFQNKPGAYERLAFAIENGKKFKKAKELFKP
ncbi:MAG: hypothetical protein LLG04_01010, partial [Parachlamydia sp.]|nr:hypothetical protein [Parachlamydia sp.]